MPLPVTIPGISSDLHHELVAKISEHVRLARDPTNLTLRESPLARMLGVSRTPVRAALRHLASTGILLAGGRAGYTVRKIPDANAAAPPLAALAEGPYSRMLRDIVLNALPRLVSESELMRRYRAGRGEMSKAMRRLVREGLAEPLAGHGWSFIEFGREQLERSYHLRLVLEPAAMLDAAYSVDRAALATMRLDHAAALQGLGRGPLGYELFELDANFHETLARGCGNELIVDIIRRQNRVRRLAEYVSYSRVDRIRDSMREHIGIIDALVRDKRQEGAELLRAHLRISSSQTLTFFDADLAEMRARDTFFATRPGTEELGFIPLG